jgi:hypothetical protein
MVQVTATFHVASTRWKKSSPRSWVEEAIEYATRRAARA